MSRLPIYSTTVLSLSLSLSLSLFLFDGHEVFASLISNLCLSVTVDGWTGWVAVQLAVSDPLSQWLKPFIEGSPSLSPKLLAAAGGCSVCCIAAISLGWNKLNSFSSIDRFLLDSSGELLLALLHTSTVGANSPSEGITAVSGHPSAIDWDCAGLSFTGFHFKQLIWLARA